MEIKLLAAYVNIPPTPEVNAESTSLVIANRLPPATQSIARNAAAYYDNAFVVAAAAGDDSSVQAPAVQPDSLRSKWASTGWDKFLSSQVFGSGWIAMTIRDAVAQYQSHVISSKPMSGQLLNVYA